jgi:thiol-disulfide isomerase/thioredoxin
MKPILSVAAFAAALLTLSGSSIANSDDAAVVPPMKAGTHQPPLEITTLDGGNRVAWEQLRGNVVVIDFWASWCAPCIASFPKLNALSDQFAGKHVLFYSVNYEKPGAVRAVLDAHPLKTHVALDGDFHTFESFNAWGIPVAYIFDGTGTLVATTHPDHLDAAAIEAVLGGKAPSLPPAQSWSDPKGAETYFRSLRDKQPG